MQYVGIDCAYARAGWCAKESAGELAEDGLYPRTRTASPA
jgi:hypothetical protein